MPVLTVPVLALSLASAPVLTDRLSLGIPALEMREGAPRLAALDFPPKPPEVAEVEKPQRPAAGLRLAAEAGGSLVGAVVGGGIAALAVYGPGGCGGGGSDGEGVPNLGCAYLLAGAIGVGASVGGAAGTNLGGDLAGGNGGFFPSLVGGLLLGAVGAVLSQQAESPIPAIVGYVAGSVIGYEISDEAP